MTVFAEALSGNRYIDLFMNVKQGRGSGEIEDRCVWPCFLIFCVVTGFAVFSPCIGRKGKRGREMVFEAINIAKFKTKVTNYAIFLILKILKPEWIGRTSQKSGRNQNLLRCFAGDQRRKSREAVSEGENIAKNKTELKYNAMLFIPRGSGVGRLSRNIAKVR